MAVQFKYLWMLMAYGILVKYADGACYTSEVSKIGDAGASFFADSVADIEACKTLCDSMSPCMAANFHNTIPMNNCVLLNAAPTSPYTPDTDYTLLIPTACCTMSRTADTKGSGTDIQLKLTNADQCGSACLYVSECKGVAYSGGSCSLYDGTPLDSNTGDALTHVKNPCSGKDCCISGTATKKAANPALKTLTSSIESCEQACVASSSCHSVHFSNDICYVYLVAPSSTAVLAGSIYSVKSCSETPTNELTFTEVCLGSGEAKPTQSILLVFLLTVLAMQTLE